jgi:multidrug efflux system membrane fusion protein
MNKSMWVAICLSIGLFVWVGFGPDRKDAVVLKQDVPLMKVKVSKIVSEPVDLIVKVHGELLPARSVTLRAETNGRIASIGVDKGKAAHAGMPILSIALDDRAARLEGARAELLRAKSDLDANNKLYQRGLLSASKLKKDEADYAAAKANLSQIESEIEHTQLNAPFTGVVDDRFVEVGDYVKSGDDVARFLDVSTLKMTGWIPQQKVTAIEEGQSVITKLVNGEELNGLVSYIAPQANNNTRAFKVEVTIKPEETIKLLGSSVSAEITTQRVSAHLLSPSVISLGADGALLVKAVNSSSEVVSYVVQVLQSDTEGLWLTGLPNEVDIITVGHGFVVEGQKVETVENTKREDAGSEDSKFEHVSESSIEASSQLTSQGV